MCDYHVRLTGDRRLTLLEAEALRHFAELGWEVTKKEMTKGMPYGPPPLTDRASQALIGAMEKLDEAWHEGKHYRDASESTPMPPFVIRALDINQAPARRRGLDGARPGVAYQPKKKKTN